MRATWDVVGQDAKDQCHDDKQRKAKEQLSWMSREHSSGGNAANETGSTVITVLPFFIPFLRIERLMVCLPPYFSLEVAYVVANDYSTAAAGRSGDART